MKAILFSAVLLAASAAFGQEAAGGAVEPAHENAPGNADCAAETEEDMEKLEQLRMDGREAVDDAMEMLKDMLDKTRSLGGEPLKANIIQLEHASASDMAKLLDVFDAEIKPQEQFNAISVKADAETLATIEQLVKRFDVPISPVSVELQFYLLTLNVPGDPPGEKLRPVINQIQQMYPNSSPALAGAFFVRGDDGQSFQVHDAAKSLGAAGEMMLGGEINTNGQNINIDTFECVFRQLGFLLSTNVSFAEDTFVVIGKSSFQPPAEDPNAEPREAFMVVTGSIVD